MLEVLRRPRVAVATGLVGAVAVAWLYLVPLSRDMYGAMSGPSAWMMQAEWDGRYFALMFLMWAVMMLGMMLPSAAPAILLFARVLQNSPQADSPVARSYAFAGGYLIAWTGFSLAATLLQWRLAEAALLSPMMEAATPTLGAAILVAAGLYQWTSLKQVCLVHCRAPAEFLTQRFRPGWRGALRMGVDHGIHCVGCCWVLMGLLFVGGIMQLTWIAAISIFVLLEKLAPFGAQLGRLGGALLVLAGIGLLLR
jgi:predicted metal-binding membrane protein